MKGKVWKKGQGYEGPGVIVAEFTNWQGDTRYVVEHRIEGGHGCFYHIYDGKQLEELHERPKRNEVD